jgi:hypothetical protein
MKYFVLIIAIVIFIINSCNGDSEKAKDTYEKYDTISDSKECKKGKYKDLGCLL